MIRSVDERKENNHIPSPKFDRSGGVEIEMGWRQDGIEMKLIKTLRISQSVTNHIPVCTTKCRGR